MAGGQPLRTRGDVVVVVPAEADDARGGRIRLAVGPREQGPDRDDVGTRDAGHDDIDVGVQVDHDLTASPAGCDDPAIAAARGGHDDEWAGAGCGRNTENNEFRARTAREVVHVDSRVDAAGGVHRGGGHRMVVVSTERRGKVKRSPKD